MPSPLCLTGTTRTHFPPPQSRPTTNLDIDDDDDDEPTWTPVCTAMTVVTNESLLHPVEREDKSLVRKEIISKSSACG